MGKDGDGEGKGDEQKESGKVDENKEGSGEGEKKDSDKESEKKESDKEEGEGKEEWEILNDTDSWRPCQILERKSDGGVLVSVDEVEKEISPENVSTKLRKKESSPGEAPPPPPDAGNPMGPDDEDDDGEEVDIWERADKYGHDWQKGDVICCSLSLPGGKVSFGLNGDFDKPMGEAFEMKVSEGAQLCLVVVPGSEGRLRVNMGQTGFMNPPPSENHRGLGEALRIRPTWKVSLPKEVKTWPVYKGPSRSSDGRKPVKNGDLLEQAFGCKEEVAGWLYHEKGWSPIKASVAGKDYEAFQLVK